MNPQKTPWSFGGGMDFHSKFGTFMYADLQTSLALFGTSHGVVYNPDMGFGYQGSAWANYILGANLQYRSLGEGFFSPGMYLSLPLPFEN